MQFVEQPSIELKEYTDHYKEEISLFYLPEEKLQFTSYPIDKIYNSNVSEDTIHVMIMNKNIPVGYFALEGGEKRLKYTLNKNARLLTSFSINNEYQGKGFAKEGLRQISLFVKRKNQEINEIVLGVNKRNTAAIQLYKKVGFEDQHEVFIGPKGEQHILHLRIR